MEKQKQIHEELQNWDNTVRKRKITLSNPVFIKGLALAPVAIAATTVKNSLVLSLAVFLLLTPTRIITSLITKRMSVQLKTFFYPLVSAIVFGLAYYSMYLLLDSTAFSLGIYLPILVVDPLIVKNFEKTRKEEFLYSIINGLRNTGGFILACVLTGTIRELLGFGTFLGFKILPVALLPMAQQAFGGFMIVALLSSIWALRVDRYHEKLLREDTRYHD